MCHHVLEWLKRSNAGEATGETRHSRLVVYSCMTVEGKSKSSCNNIEYGEMILFWEGELEFLKEKNFCVRKKTLNQYTITTYTQISFKKKTSSQILSQMRVLQFLYENEQILQHVNS